MIFLQLEDYSILVNQEEFNLYSIFVFLQSRLIFFSSWMLS